jgi:hypothetical protein
MLVIELESNVNDYCVILIMHIRMVPMALIVNEGLMDDDTEVLTVVVVVVKRDEPVLQLLVLQHDTTVPDAVVPEKEAVHVMLDETHEYVFVTVPDAQIEEVLNKLEL